MNFKLIHLLRSPQVENHNPPALFLLHGVGSNEYDLFGLASLLPKEFMILSLRAPNKMAPNSHAWYPFEITSSGYKIEADVGIESRMMISEFIAEAVNFYQIDPKKIYLMGFSQGAIMSYSLMMTQPDSLAGVVAMSGRLDDELFPDPVNPQELAGFPLMVTHGLSDDVIPINFAQEAKAVLSNLPVDLTYKEYPMGHEISQASINDIVGWLKDQLEK